MASKKTSVRGPGRPKRAVGLSLGDMLKAKIEVSDGVPVREVQDVAGRPDRSVLPGPREGGPASAGGGGVFAAADDLDARRREPAAIAAEVPDPAGRSLPQLGDDDLNLTGWLRRIISEIAADEFQDPSGRRRSNAEVLARKMMDKALRDDKLMMEIVVDRIEGKAVRAAQVNAVDKTLDDQLDRLDTAKLDGFAKED